MPRPLPLAALLPALACAPCAQELPHLVVHVDQPGHRLSAQLYGVFFEEINHAGEGGLCAQLLRNPTFEEPGTQDDPLPGWRVAAVDRSRRDGEAAPAP